MISLSSMSPETEVSSLEVSALGPLQKNMSFENENQEMLEVVKDASNLKLLEGINRLLEDEDLLQSAAKKTYRHQLGFMKVVLMSKPNGGSLRLHVWDQPEGIPEDIHSHCASFISRVVRGSLVENAFELTPGETHAYFRYHFDADRGHSCATRDGLTGVRLKKVHPLGTGETYVKQALELHSVSEVELGTITVSAWADRNSEAVVLKDKHASAEDCLATSGVLSKELRLLLEKIKVRILNVS